MAKINRTELVALRSRPQDGDPLKLSERGAGPPIGQLQSKARMSGAFDFDNAIGRFNPENITMKQRRQMRRDPMIALGLHYKKVPLMNAPWRIECSDPQVAAFVDKNLRRIYAPLLEQMLSSLEWGYKPIVKRFQREVPDWTFEDPITREKKPVWPDKDIPAVTWNTFQGLPSNGAKPLFTEDDQSFIGFEHTGFQTPQGKALKVPAKYALWIANERWTSDGDWYGWPLTGYVYRYWWSYWYSWLLADRHFEQDADPPLVVRYPSGSGPDPDDPTVIVDNYVIALKVAANLRDGAGIAIPSEHYESLIDGRVARGAEMWSVEFLRGGENMKAFQERFSYLDVMKLRGLLTPEQALIPGDSGTSSKNVASTYGDLFAESQAILMADIDSHINEYMIPDLVAQNFVDAPECRKVTEGFRDEDMGAALDLIGIIASQDPGALQIDWRSLVEQARFPLLSEEQLNDPKTIIPQSARQKVADAAEQESLNHDGETRGKNKNPAGPTGA